jgi:hypothetical protein
MVAVVMVVMVVIGCMSWLLTRSHLIVPHSMTTCNGKINMF